ncbi:hypothetical protein ABT112_25280 [Streptomyces sp. NPDC002055]|uniref:hypothetical protein n=1 Tax=Streptomyces sp. NPDC002055 TaxID=3154534 RepID=UPI00332D2C05
MSATNTEAARRWLAAADPDPVHADRWWDTMQVALLPVGQKWDAVRLGADDGIRITQRDDITGPVIHDSYGRIAYVLVPRGTSATWQVDGTECFGELCYLAVPAPERTEPPGPYWLQAPDGSGLLTDPATLAAALADHGPQLPAEAFG